MGGIESENNPFAQGLCIQIDVFKPEFLILHSVPNAKVLLSNTKVLLMKK